MADNNNLLLRANLKQLKLPAMAAEFEKLAREAADANEGYEQYLLRLTEVEVSARASNALQARIRVADFPVAKDFDTFDFTAVPSVNKPKLLELARGEWIEQRSNVCFIGETGTVVSSNTFYVNGHTAIFPDNSTSGALDAQTPIVVDNGTNLTITGNGIHVTSTAAGDAGLALDSTSGLLTGNMFDTGGTGVGLRITSRGNDGAAGILSLWIEKNDFNANAVGVLITSVPHALASEPPHLGPNSTFNVDLGGGPLGSVGQNDFSNFRPSLISPPPAATSPSSWKTPLPIALSPRWATTGVDPSTRDSSILTS